MESRRKWTEGFKKLKEVTVPSVEFRRQAARSQRGHARQDNCAGDRPRVCVVKPHFGEESREDEVQLDRVESKEQSYAWELLDSIRQVHGWLSAARVDNVVDCQHRSGWWHAIGVSPYRRREANIIEYLLWSEKSRGAARTSHKC